MKTDMDTRTITKGLILTIIIILSSCEYRNCIDGDGKYVIQTRNINETFTGIEMDGSFNVFIKQDSIVSVEVEADENILPFVITRVRGGILLIDDDKQCIRTKGPINVYITMPFVNKVILDGSGIIEVDTIDAALAEIELNGSGEIFVDVLYADDCHLLLDGSGLIIVNRLTADIADVNHASSGEIIIKDVVANSIDLDLDGSGAIEVYRIYASEISAMLGGSGKIKLEGDVDFAALSITGSGNIDAFRLYQTECDAFISGSGTIYTFVLDYLTADIPGTGFIYFRGSPRITLINDTPAEHVVPS